MAHQAGAYPGFQGMKRLGVFVLPPGWDASPSQGYPQHFAGTHLYTWVERGTVGVKCLTQEHNTMSPARTRTRTIRSGVEQTKRPLLFFVGSSVCSEAGINGSRRCFLISPHPLLGLRLIDTIATRIRGKSKQTLKLPRIELGTSCSEGICFYSSSLQINGSVS